jgi:N-methylhydantoinase A/oxoprolinase/acetone carboxylase beta subunit
MRIGVDVGGTNTDAVLMDGARVVTTVKVPTTPDVMLGVTLALEHVLLDSATSAAAIAAVMIGTTHFTNAVVERRRLAPVAALRICLPASAGIPPFTDWPRDLAEVVRARSDMVAGGYEFDGREIAPLDERGVARIAREIRALGIGAVAVSSVFAPANAAMELRAEEIIRNEHPDAAVSLSSAVGRVGLLERENATILNASLTPLARSICSAFGAALARLNIAAPFFISQNDGTLMNPETVARYPVLTFASGPTNSMRGAAFLAAVKDALVIDVGGTTTDLGLLSGGFPRQSSQAVSFAGVRTNFRMPDVLSIGIGGGSSVRARPEVTIGPDSVGYQLQQRALVFGGDTLTATDIAVAAGLADVGQPGRVAHLDRALVHSALAVIKGRIEEAAGRMKVSAAAIPVVLVGGGSILLDDTLRGASMVLRPQHFAVANAVGAAIAQVGGEVDQVYSYEALGRDAAVRQAMARAAAAAVAAGAAPDSIDFVEVDELPLAYMPGGAVRLRVKAVGDLAGLRVAG